MDKINTMIEQLDNNINIRERINLLKKLTKLIDKEKSNLNKLLTRVNDIDQKVSKKYKKLELDEIEEKFFNSNEILDKIKLFETFNYKVKESMIEIFNNSEESDLESDLESEVE